MIDTDLLKSNIKIVQSVIDYFAAKSNDADRFSIIKEKAILNGKRFNSPNSEQFIGYGFLAPMDCIFYLSENGFPNSGRVIDEAIRALEENLLIYPIDKMLTTRTTDLRYNFNGEFASFLYRNNLILNVILGFEYIIQTYRKSVLKIEPTLNDGSKSIGTGFIVEYNKNTYVVTNKHVVENNHELSLYDENDDILIFTNVFLNPEKDVAIIILENNIDINPFQLNEDIKLLDEIITIGYPSVPMTKFAYQICHKGEVNSFVQDYSNNNIILISAKTSSGNSGSPVIDSSGRVVGIVTQELYEEEEFYKKGKLPYYAALAVKDIIETIDQYIINNRV
ncbi:MAG: trypsin-like peptidase domain-containing protein [Bacteroidetes bacterium]|nr:trypsin-like peptidase domain-containing protein [Bacteroidota bacterium]